MRLDSWLEDAAARLSKAGIDATVLEAQLLAGHILGLERSAVLAHPQRDVASEIAFLERSLERRLAREPLAYILGWREFYGRRFIVRSGVLVPRQETELLVETALELGPAGDADVLDVGVGSGAIAITLSLERPAWCVCGTEISEQAVEIASENCAAMHANAHIQVADLFPRGAFDLIVSNPPYVAETDPVGAELAYEPTIALYAAEKGLAVYRRLASEAPPHLLAGGIIVLEIGLGQAPSIMAIFADQGWRHKETRSDLAGIERVLVFDRP